MNRVIRDAGGAGRVGARPAGSAGVGPSGAVSGLRLVGGPAVKLPAPIKIDVAARDYPVSVYVSDIGREHWELLRADERALYREFLPTGRFVRVWDEPDMDAIRRAGGAGVPVGQPIGDAD